MPNFIILANARWNTEGRGGNSSQQYAYAVLRRGWRVAYIQKDGANLLTPVEELDLGPETVVMCDMPWVEFYIDTFLAMKAKGCRTVYRVVDNWNMTFRRTEYSEEREIAFIQAADAAFASSPLNVERFQHIRPDMKLLRNGVDLESFWNWQGERPANMIMGEPTAVFLASFWDPDWVDWQSLIYAAECCPKLSINVLGEVPDNLPEISNLREAGNIHLLGKQDWRSLPGYLHNADVGLVAYNEENARYNNPLKVLEYLGCGLPVVCYPNVSVDDYPYVYFYHNPKEFTEQIKAASNTAVDREYLHTVLQNHTWDRRLEEMLAGLGVQ